MWFSLLMIISSVFFTSQEKVRAVFDNLIQLEHLNIVKFHKYWADVKENRARVGDHITSAFFFFQLVFMLWCHSYMAALLFCLQVIFITEYMSSGSLKQFLKKTKKNHKTMNEKVWKLNDNDVFCRQFIKILFSLFCFINVSHELFLFCQAWKRWCIQILSALRLV